MTPEQLAMMIHKSCEDVSPLHGRVVLHWDELNNTQKALKIAVAKDVIRKMCLRDTEEIKE